MDCLAKQQYDLCQKYNLNQVIFKGKTDNYIAKVDTLLLMNKNTSIGTKPVSIDNFDMSYGDLTIYNELQKVKNNCMSDKLAIISVADITSLRSMKTEDSCALIFLKKGSRIGDPQIVNLKSGNRKDTAKSVGIFVLIWILLGIVAFFMSLVCFGKGENMTQNIIGLLIAVIFGPFYFIYYFAMKKQGYCRV